jgi:hypothetical protein
MVLAALAVTPDARADDPKLRVVMVMDAQGIEDATSSFILEEIRKQLRGSRKVLVADPAAVTQARDELSLPKGQLTLVQARQLASRIAASHIALVRHAILGERALLKALVLPAGDSKGGSDPEELEGKGKRGQIAKFKRQNEEED